MKIFPFLFYSLICGVLSCQSATAPPRELFPTSLRTLKSGQVVGYESDSGTLGWLGIPYAATPLGDLRWRAPRPPTPWQGVREAIQFSPACLQRGSWLGGAPAKEIGKLFGSEDCLYLNIWAPKEVPADGLPVMIWIHGGGNTTGHGGFYDFSQMAERFSLIMITFNYRLGSLGWFYHPSLWTEGDSDLDRSGNYGFLDQIALLKWVKENISDFGGDPNRMTIFGESAGGQDTLAHMVSPLSAGLFKGAIAQSGYTSSVSVAEASHLTSDEETGWERSSGEMLLYWLEAEGLASSRESALEILKTRPEAELGRFLRGLASERVVLDYYGDDDSHGAPIMIRDGSIIPGEGIAAALRDGNFHPVPLVAGTNRDENNLWLAFSPELVRNYLGAFYRVKDESRFRFFSEYRSQAWKARGADDPNRWVTKAGGTAYGYRWDWDEEPRNLLGDFALLVGAAHGLETTFLTGHFPEGGRAGLLFTAENLDGRMSLARSMQSYWAEFAYTGKPGRGRDGDLPDWKPWSLGPGAKKFMVLDTPADRGIRMSDQEVELESLLSLAASDKRVAELEDLCWLVYLNLKDDPFYRPALYHDWRQQTCQPFSPAYFEAK